MEKMEGKVVHEEHDKKRISFAGKFNSRQMKNENALNLEILSSIDLLTQIFMLLSKHMSPHLINLRLFREKCFYFWFYVRIHVGLFR